MSYHDVAVAGSALAIGVEEAAEPFLTGLGRLRERRFFVANQAAGLEGDPVAMVGIALGLHSLKVSETKWFGGLLRESMAREIEESRRQLIVLAQTVIDQSPSNLSALCPVLRVALAVKGHGMPDVQTRQAALKAVIDFSDLQPDWALFQEAALRVLFAFESCVDTVQPTIDQVVRLLEGVPAALKRWPWEPKPRTPRSQAQKWDLQNEYHVQSLIWSILRPIFPTLEDEEYLKSIGHMHPKADLAIPGLRLIIEIKFLYQATNRARAKLIEQISSDTGLYLAHGSEFDQVVVFIWDSTGSSNHHAEIKSGLAKLKGVWDSVIVSRPGDWIPRWADDLEDPGLQDAED